MCVSESSYVRLYAQVREKVQVILLHLAMYYNFYVLLLPTCKYKQVISSITIIMAVIVDIMTLMILIMIIKVI